MFSTDLDVSTRPARRVHAATANDSERPESLENPNPEATEEDDSSGTGFPGPDPEGAAD